MKLSLKIFLVISASMSGVVVAGSTYDQSQTGELNVQVELKDVQIIALMKSSKEEYVDYDYAYDYSEMTIKPHNGTTPKPLNVSHISNPTTAVMMYNSTADTTVFVETTTEFIKNNTIQSLSLPIVTEHSVISESTTLTKSTEAVTTKTPEIADLPVTAPTVANVTNCKKGFILNQKGACEFKLQSASNALLKIIKLSQKLKRRESRQEIQEDKK